MVFFLLLKVEVADKIYNVPQLPSLSLFCSPPEQRKGVKCKEGLYISYKFT